MNPQIFYEMEKNIKKALKYSKKIILNSRCKDLPFHNLEHTLEVYKNLIKIGTYENIGYEELEPIIIAGLFHDTGNAFRFDGHEDVEYSDEEWLILNIKFLQNHRFHSQYGRLKLEPQKQINLDELRRQYESLCRS